MIQIRKSQERGHFDHGWLNTYHTFSFSEYYDAEHMSYRHLRVINEDFVAEAEGFDTHPHKDMEIITYIVSGSLEHKDSMGTGSVIRPGDIQRMSAGTGVLHSEFNHSKTEKVHLLQIWIFPEKKGIEPSYEQKNFSIEERKDQLKLVASKGGKDDTVEIHQDVKLYASILSPGKSVEHKSTPGRHLWIQLVRGELQVNDSKLQPGDGAAITAEDIQIRSSGKEEAEFLLFDLN